MARVLCAALLVLPALAGGESAGGEAAFDHGDLDLVLRRVVRDEGVDYPRIRENYLPALELYLDRAASADTRGMPEAERLAFYINAYNATVLRTVAERFRQGFSVEKDRFALFDEPLVSLGGKQVSLNHLEHEIIRPGFDEPRIHAALVCAARSCPPLLPRAYRAEDLDRVLEENMQRFLASAERNRIDIPGRRLQLSRIFDWYAKDFGGKQGLPAYADRYTDADVAGFDVSFLEYSWELNLAPSQP